MGNIEFLSPYIPNTDQDRKKMLEVVGVEHLDDLFQDIPSDLRNPKLELPLPSSEFELLLEAQRLAEMNFRPGKLPCFLGAGVYRHFTPSVIGALASRGEFLTSYTPYQPEVSQGTLQSGYEFQTMASNLLNMDVANAGMYDGATSLAEAALMACRISGRYKVAILKTVAPNYVEVVRTYTEPQGIDIFFVDPEEPELDSETACVLVQHPNFFGYLEDMSFWEQFAHANGSLLCVSMDPIAAAMFKPPGDYGADIATSEGQALGVPSSFGGPFVGLFASREEFLRQMPGRLVGKTIDSNGSTGYVLTLQTREQHIRRDRATSNICTSTALVALMATIYTACMGKRGLRHIAELCYEKSHYAANEIGGLPGYSLPREGVFFQEFLVVCPTEPKKVNAILLQNGIIGGYDVSDQVTNGMLFSFSELNTRSEIDRLLEVLRGIS